MNSMTGSSPLSRGILWVDGEGPEIWGIIPALAGNTPALGLGRLPKPDHPRSRGEYRPGKRLNCSSTGSSPLSRGIRNQGHDSQRRRRIIPALAGNTPPQRRQHHPHQDHPRSRGEYRNSSIWPVIFVWIIPALAGNTRYARQNVLPVADHPRSRGEYGTV